MNNKVISSLPQKYIISVIGEKHAGKTTTIKKAFHKLKDSGRITIDQTLIWGARKKGEPGDFHAIVDSVYGTTGILSSGDVTKQIFKDIKDNFIDKKKCNIILCACRKDGPKTYSAIAEIAWRYNYTILWVDLTTFPKGSEEQNDHTNQKAEEITELFPIIQ